MSESVPSESPEVTPAIQETCDEPPMKKSKFSGSKSDYSNLEQRLEGVLCCVVCLDLPVSAVYQCSNGHLMCAGCFNHIFADALLRDGSAKCPSCRVDLSKLFTTRNLAVEKALSELPSDCRFCSKAFPRNLLTNHENDCEDRLVYCKYQRIGCIWRGPYHESLEHIQGCAHPLKSGAEVMETLQIMQKKDEEERLLLKNIFDLLSFENINFNDLQMKPYRTDEYFHKLFYETNRFSAASEQWVVKARISNTNNKEDPCESTDRTLVYQLCLKNSRPMIPIVVHYLIVQGPFGDIKVSPKIYKFEFKECENDSPFLELPLTDNAECNRLLASKVIRFRIIMFIVSK